MKFRQYSGIFKKPQNLDKFRQNLDKFRTPRFTDGESAYWSISMSLMPLSYSRRCKKCWSLNKRCLYSSWTFFRLVVIFVTCLVRMLNTNLNFATVYWAIQYKLCQRPPLRLGYLAWALSVTTRVDIGIHFYLHPFCSLARDLTST